MYVELHHSPGQPSHHLNERLLLRIIRMIWIIRIRWFICSLVCPMTWSLVQSTPLPSPKLPHVGHHHETTQLISLLHMTHPNELNDSGLWEVSAGTPGSYFRERWGVLYPSWQLAANPYRPENGRKKIWNHKNFFIVAWIWYGICGKQSWMIMRANLSDTIEGKSNGNIWAKTAILGKQTGETFEQVCAQKREVSSQNPLLSSLSSLEYVSIIWFEELAERHSASFSASFSRTKGCKESNHGT